MVLTSADGQSIYVEAVTFLEDLAAIEAAHLRRRARFPQPSPPEPNKQKPIGSIKFELKSPLRSTAKPLRTKTKTMDMVALDLDKDGGEGLRAKRRTSLDERALLSFQYDIESSEDETLAQQNDSSAMTSNNLQLDEEEKQVPLQPGSFYIEKALCILSRQPFFEHFRLVLVDVKRASECSLRAPLEDYVAQLVYAIPAPPRGIAQVNLKLISKNHPFRNLLFKYPPINKLPYANNDFIITLFDSLNVDNVLLFFKRVLLDSNVSLLV